MYGRSSYLLTVEIQFVMLFDTEFSYKKYRKLDRLEGCHLRSSFQF